MKSIIACTDFSPIADNAVRYAAALASATSSRLVLFHYFSAPIPATDLPGIFPSMFQEQLVTDHEHRLKESKKQLSHEFNVEISCITRSFDFSLDLEKVFHDEKAELVVMGIQGQSAVMNAILGSVTAATIRRGKLPVIAVPHDTNFHPIKKILFPSDQHHIANPAIIQPLLDLAHVFDAYIEVLTLFDLEKTPTLAPDSPLATTNNNLETLLAKTHHGYSYENESAVNQGILYEAARSNADLVAMIPHHHSFWSSLLNQSETQRIATAINIPLLVLGEKG